ncbi:S-adenosyl-l-methionine hydroxide adenosyltransferase family protein [Actinokineospora guangxiensis]|uniref:S-adenosyl-l-methionine hydroxide adenosyltransferase family protein n=1 Tax=Actinokineospora guangxiensis TaxID=1490288 RepID=A0ABW0EE40_9PSEU
MTYDWITFTTDYGLADGFPAICEGVIARIAPAVRVVHVTHQVPAQDVRRGADLLAQAVPYLPSSVHLAVVDPGVGTRRRAVAVAALGGVLVGPDNGLLVPAAAALGGVVGAVELTEVRLEPVSPTFHGRDVFAPAAAHLALGRPMGELGPEVDPATLIRLPAPVTSAVPGRVTTEVLGADGFGNIQLAATADDLTAAGTTPGRAVHVEIGGRSLQARMGRTFADAAPGSAVVLVDSAARVAVAINGGSAQSIFATHPGDTAVLLVERH